MEKSLYNQVGEIKGASSETEDAFSFQFTPQNENLKRTRGALFTLVSISGKTDERYEKAKDIYHQFQSSYYAKATGSILHGLSETLEQLSEGPLRKQKEEGLNISVIAAVFWGTVVYLSKYGEGAVFVARADKVKKLDFAKVASGVLEDQDTVCLATESFVTAVTLDELTESLTKEKFEDSLETLDKKVEKVQGAVCDVIRLSVNAPTETTEDLAIAEVNEKGEMESTEAPEEKSEDETQKTEHLESDAESEKPVESKANDPFEQAIEKKQNPLSKVLPTVKGFAGNFTKSILKVWRRPEPGEHHDPVAIRRTRIIQAVGLILIILIISIGFGIFSQGAEKKDNKVSNLITSAQNGLNEASNIKTIDPNRALSLVNKAQKDLEEAKKTDEDNKQITELQSKSTDLEAEITKTTKIKDLETVFDFGTLHKGTAITDAALLGNQLLLIDANQGFLYELLLDDKRATEVSKTDTSVQTIVSYPAGFYLSGQSGISKVDSSLKISSIGTNANWGKIRSSATYQNNLYLLDTEKNEIWRYLSTSTGLGSARAYVSGEKPDMSAAVAIAIDDLVWVANKNGTVYKFASGKQQENFAISALADPIGELSDMFTSSSTKNHYFLDKGKARIVSVDKKGVYQASYTNNQLHKADTLLVDETQKIVYFTAESKLYQFKLP